MTSFDFYYFFPVALLILMICYRYGSLLYLTAGYIFVNGLTNAYYPDLLSKKFGFKADELARLDVLAMGSLKTWVLSFVVFIFIMNMKKELFEKMDSLWGYVALGNCLFILYHRFFAQHAPSGILSSSSMDGTFLGIVFPTILLVSNNRWVKYLLVSLVVFTIFITQSSIGIGGLCLGVGAVLLLQFKDTYIKQTWKEYLIIFSVPVALFATAYWLNPHLFEDSKRFVAWKWSMDWWNMHANHQFGTGLGTYLILSPYVQSVMGFAGMRIGYVSLHNSWLQCLFQLGWMGAGLVLAVFLDCLRRAYRKPLLFAMVLSFGACATMNYLSEHIVTAILGVYLVRLCYDMD